VRLRQWIGLVAMLGVLLHAAALVRHHGVMLAAHLKYQALISDLSIICHGAATDVGTASADLPHVPKPSDAQNGCPICSGQAPATAVAAALDLVEVHQPASVAIGWHEPRNSTPIRLRQSWPPARGPPTSAAFI